MKLDNHFGDAMRDARRNLGMSQMTLAERADLD